MFYCQQTTTVSHLTFSAHAATELLDEAFMAARTHCTVINPFPPSVPIWHRLAKLSILILEGIIKKITYERRDYESVDEKSLS